MAPPDVKRLVPADVLRHFVPDGPYPRVPLSNEDRLEGQIEGCTAMEIPAASDDRGDLFELMSLRDGIEPIVHAYQVFCAPGSIRAWIYHSEQTDRLCYTEGLFRVALCDLRSGSRTAGNIAVLMVGAKAPTLLCIPPFVAHGVQNLGSERAAFLNMPTMVYDHAAPDKRRLPFDSPLIPFTW